MLAEAAATQNEAQCQEIYMRVQQAIAKDVSVAWMLELDFPTIYSCDVKDLVETAIGVNDGLRDPWLDR